MLMAVTAGTTQPARSSARRVKSFCLSDVSDVSAFTSGTSSSRESAMLSLQQSSCVERICSSVRNPRQPRRSARVLRHERQSCLGRQAREPVVPREPFAVRVHQQMLKVSAQPRSRAAHADASSTSSSRPGISRTRL